MLLLIMLLPVLHLSALNLQLVILLSHVKTFKSINIFDENPYQKLRQIGILVHGFGLSFLASLN